MTDDALLKAIAWAAADDAVRCIHSAEHAAWCFSLAVSSGIVFG